MATFRVVRGSGSLGLGGNQRASSIAIETSTKSVRKSWTTWIAIVSRQPEQ